MNVKITMVSGKSHHLEFHRNTFEELTSIIANARRDKQNMVVSGMNGTAIMLAPQHIESVEEE